MLVVENLSFSYNSKKKVLDNVSFHVHDGIFTALLGPNGTGKSTLIKTILQILKYKEGKITSDGVDVSKLSIIDRAKLFAYVPQNIELGSMTVFDAVLLGRKSYTTWAFTQEDYKKTSEVIEKLELNDLILRNVDELSGGEKQKVAIARAINQETRYIFLDEPISNLDIKNQMECLNLLKNINKNFNLTILVSMHDLNMALRYFEHFVLMKDNTIYKNSTIDNLTKEDIKQCFGIDSEIIQKDGVRLLLPIEEKNEK